METTILDKQLLFETCKAREYRLRDRYDIECISSSLIRRIAKKVDQIHPRLLYQLHICRYRSWSENIRMLCECAVQLGRTDEAKAYYTLLTSTENDAAQWGLPVPWHSGAYLFPPGTLMSTTTSEIVCFLNRCEIDISGGYRQRKQAESGARRLLKELNKIVDTPETLILSYTPLDRYRVINANLLVASALSCVGSACSDQEMLQSSHRILMGCTGAIASDGAIPYFYDGGRVDSYHQVFCIKALLELEQVFPEAETLRNRAVSFLETQLIDSQGRVYLDTSKESFDLQGFAEVLSLYRIMGEVDRYNCVKNALESTLFHRGRLYQSVSASAATKPIYSRFAFARQGYLRLACAL